ncbi:MAG: alpha/beta fold hydrolase [Vallitaleaceae bacterium]|jgi:alpha-beta hydrolase superfamily lysophospholipase|nr:alpha/beta fold hydrolase [Vallitaleaceae bacterium]
MKNNFILKGSGVGVETPIACISWLPEGTINGIVHICHGMAEYADRYHDFAVFLNQQGYGVYAHDHRQHGKSVRPGTKVGIFGKQDTWKHMLDDIEIVQKHIRANHSVPMFIHGHSMGAVIVRNYLQITKLKFVKAVITGVPDITVPLWRMGRTIAGILGLFNKQNPSDFLNNLSVGGFNKGYYPIVTKNDWLSKDLGICRNYESDPLCGFAYSPKFYYELSKGFLSTHKKRHIKKTQKIPMLFLSGAEDPVGVNKDNMISVFKFHQNAGLEPYINQIIYGGMRHEILNEVEKNKVYEQIVTYLKQ